MILYMNILIALFISLFISAVFLYGIHKRDFYATGKFHYNTTAIMAGALVSFIAGAVQSQIVAGGLMSRDDVTRAVAPILEEFLKAVVLFYLVSRVDFNYVVDGAIYGVGAGLGFAIVETIFYVTGTDGPVVGLARDRALSTNLIHAAASGLIGSALAAGRLERGLKRALVMVFGFIIAISLHMFYNYMVTGDASIVFAILAGFISLGCVALIIKLNLAVQGRWIVESLGMIDQVTAGEAAVVQRIQNMDEVLIPIVRQFGPDKAAKTESLIYLQAEIGIKRKIVQATPDPDKRLAIELEIRRLTSEMNALRKAIGPYCLLFVRSIYLARGSQLWDVISARVRAAGQGPAGGGLWKTLDRRIKSSKTRVADREQ